MPPLTAARRAGRGIRRLLLHESHHRSRIDTSISDIQESGIDFEDKVLEEAWKVDGLRLSMELGSRTLLFVGSLGLVVRILQFTRRFNKIYEIKWHLFAMGFEFMFLFVTLFICKSLVRNPRKYIYGSVVVCWYVYILLICIPPWNPSCTDLFRIFLTNSERGVYISRTIHSLDCTIQGGTVMQIHMGWLLISPRLLPDSNAMIFNWFWIFVMYLGASYWYRWFSGDNFYKTFDICISLGLLSLTNAIAIQKKYYLIKSQKSKYFSDRKQREASEKMFRILEYMVPMHVIVRMLKYPGKVIADPVDCVSILFIVIVDFDRIAHTKTPEEVLAFLNLHFLRFDSSCQQNEVTKIETVGEEYVCAVGVVPSKNESQSSGHERCLGQLISTAWEILDSQQTEAETQFQVKMGIHTGPVVAGVIGQKLPRFRLFGDTINTAARMMQKGIDGELQFGEETKQHLPEWVPVKLRGQIEMKGKGQVTTYLLDRSCGDACSSITSPSIQLLRRSTEISKDDQSPIIPPVKTPPRSPIISPAMAPKLPKVPSNSRLVTPSASDADPILGKRQVSFADDVNQSPCVPLSTGSAGSHCSIRKSLVEVVLQQPGAHSDAADAELELSTAVARSEVLPRLPLHSSVSSSSRTYVDSSPVSSKNSHSNRATMKSEQSSAPSMYARSQASTCSNIFRKDTEELLAKEAAWQRQFEEALHEISKSDAPQDVLQAFGGRWLAALGLNRERFQPDMEDKWLQWFHDTTICKKLAERLDKQEQALAIVTAVDAVALVLSGALSSTRYGCEYDTYDRRYRLPIFLVCRALSFMILFLWRSVATCLVAGGCKMKGNQKNMCRNCKLIHKKPATMQFWLLVSSLVTCILIFFSYDAMVFTEPIFGRGEEPHTEKDLREAFEKDFERSSWVIEKRSIRVYSLIVMPIFFLCSTQHPLRFIPSTSFVVVAAALVSLDWFHKVGRNRLNIILSPIGKFVFLATTLINVFWALSAEQESRARFQATCSLKDTHERIEKILNTLMPPMVVEDIRECAANASLPCHKYGCATIAQSDLVGFTKLAASRRPDEVVELISDLFSKFDELSDKYGIYKVETVGDAYQAGQADFPLTRQNKPCSVLLFGLDMVRETLEWSDRGERRLGVTCRVGVHTGECIGGIIGHEMQRYHLFGELMTVVEVLESTAPEGKVQVSAACKEASDIQMRVDGFPSDYIRFEMRREQRLMTSKGDPHEFAEVGGQTYVVKGSLRVRPGRGLEE